jgi:hypothetical protein
VTRLLLAIYLVEAGLVLIVAPWTTFWDRNYFATLLPWLRPWLGSPILRGCVVVIGLITAGAGVRELTTAVVSRARARLTVSNTPPPDA